MQNWPAQKLSILSFNGRMELLLSSSTCMYVADSNARKMMDRVNRNQPKNKILNRNSKTGNPVFGKLICHYARTYTLSQISAKIWQIGLGL